MTTFRTAKGVRDQRFDRYVSKLVAKARIDLGIALLHAHAITWKGDHVGGLSPMK